jgi:bacteriocin biosynthesis cyclodehydratase domain-containing protein
MKVDIKQKLRSLPAQVIEFENGIILRRGCTEFKIDGPEARRIVQTILAGMSEEGGTLEEVFSFVPEPYKEAVGDLTAQLLARRFLVPAGTGHDMAKPEDALDVFYWNFGYQSEDVSNSLNSRRITIMGVNCITRQLSTSLRAANLTNFELVDYPLLRNLRLFDENGELRLEEWPPTGPLPVPFKLWTEAGAGEPRGCLVAASDFGGMHLLREWNEYCVADSRDFLPVVLQNAVGYVGPLVIPGETACYECLRGRQNSHLADPPAQRAAELKAFEGQFVDGFHPSMASVLGDLAAIELTKFYARVPRWRVGALIEVSLLSPSMVSRKVLKLPRCRVCSTLKRHPGVAIERIGYQPAQEHVATR